MPSIRGEASVKVIISFYVFNDFRCYPRPFGQQEIDGIADGVYHKKDEDADPENQDHHENETSNNKS